MLFTRHCSLVTVHSSLFTRHWSLVTVHSSLFTRHSLVRSLLLEDADDRCDVDAALEVLPYGEHVFAMADGFRGLGAVLQESELRAVVPLERFFRVHAQPLARVLNEQDLVLRNLVLRPEELHHRTYCFSRS